MHKNKSKVAPLAHSGRRFLSTAETMALLNYRSKGAFWTMVRNRALPHVRLTERKILFDVAQLNDFLASRSVGPKS